MSEAKTFYYYEKFLFFNQNFAGGIQFKDTLKYRNRFFLHYLVMKS